VQPATLSMHITVDVQHFSGEGQDIAPHGMVASVIS
jgi:hypothetical protein